MQVSFPFFFTLILGIFPDRTALPHLSNNEKSCQALPFALDSSLFISRLDFENLALSHFISP